MKVVILCVLTFILAIALNPSATVAGGCIPNYYEVKPVVNDVIRYYVITTSDCEKKPIGYTDIIVGSKILEPIQILPPTTYGLSRAVCGLQESC